MFPKFIHVVQLFDEFDLRHMVCNDLNCDNETIWKYMHENYDMLKRKFNTFKKYSTGVKI